MTAPNAKYRIGMRFGKIELLEFSVARNRWKCRCSCGAIVYKAGKDLNRRKPMCAQCCKEVHPYRGTWTIH